jgi:hypothetical protein
MRQGLVLGLRPGFKEFGLYKVSKSYTKMTLSPNSGHPIVKWNIIRQKVRQETYFIVIKQIIK